MTVQQRDIEAIKDLGTLAEPVRLAIYQHVIVQPDGAGREAVANAVGISRALAAFHLDRLVEAGLLVPGFRRLNDRRGPGAGRPSKIYRRASREVAISLPRRHYERAGRLLLDAISRQRRDGVAMERALADAAREVGLGLGDEARRRAGARAGRARLLEAAMGVLSEEGYEPRPEGTSLVLGNCPFDALARQNQAVICEMNLSIMDGVLEGLRARGIVASLDPRPGMCCVVWGPAANPVGRS
jgi:predicted ArsR family transcriptional regulator